MIFWYRSSNVCKFQVSLEKNYFMNVSERFTMLFRENKIENSFKLYDFRPLDHSKVTILTKNNLIEDIDLIFQP